jgi:hypothetical protein
MEADGLIERLRSTSEKCRYYAATASDPEVAQTLAELAKDMDSAVSALSDDAHSEASKAS